MLVGSVKMDAQPLVADPAFNPDDIGWGRADASLQGIQDVCLLADGKMLVTGNFHGYSGYQVNRLARLHTDGTLDTSFDTGTGTTIGSHRFAELPDGKLLVAGISGTFNGMPYQGVIRLNPDGSVDPTFQPALTSGGVQDMIVQADGKIILAGSMGVTPGQRSVVRLHPDGELDISFDSVLEWP